MRVAVAQADVWLQKCTVLCGTSPPPESVTVDNVRPYMSRVIVEMPEMTSEC